MIGWARRAAVLEHDGPWETRARDLSLRDVGRQVTLHWQPTDGRSAVAILVEGRLHRIVAAEPITELERPVTLYVDGGPHGWPVVEPVDVLGDQAVVVLEHAEASRR